MVWGSATSHGSDEEDTYLSLRRWQPEVAEKIRVEAEKISNFVHRCWRKREVSAWRPLLIWVLMKFILIFTKFIWVFVKFIWVFTKFIWVFIKIYLSVLANFEFTRNSNFEFLKFKSSKRIQTLFSKKANFWKFYLSFLANFEFAIKSNFEFLNFKSSKRIWIQNSEFLKSICAFEFYLSFEMVVDHY